MMSFVLLFVWSPKKFNVHLCQNVPFVLVCFEASAAPRPEISDSDEKDALFDLDTRKTIIFHLSYLILKSTIVICNSNILQLCRSTYF
jgi:hypothetical protein